MSQFKIKDGILVSGNSRITAPNAPSTSAITGGLIIDTGVGVSGNINVAQGSDVFVGGDRVATLPILNQSIALLRSEALRPTANVLYVSQSGDDSRDGRTLANAVANIHVALSRATELTTVYVKAGDYTLYKQPVNIGKRVGLVGDNLRTVMVRPANLTQDMFYVNNGSYATGITFRDHLAPSAVFSFNPDGSAGVITTSPYIQNSSSITTTGCGMRVDGNYVEGNRSMVCDSYTQTNAGGIGIHMLNRGYTQLVSVFTICCDIAVLCENGGFCSITNSNASFGNKALVARGVSKPLYYGKLESIEDTGEELLFTLNDLGRKPNYGDAVLFASYDREKCKRDTGLVVDSLAFDLAYSGNSQSKFAGLQYWEQGSSSIPSQAEETIAAFMYAADVAANVVSNVTISRRQNNVTQRFGVSSGDVSVLKIKSEFNLIKDIIQNGTVGVTDRIVPNKFPALSDANIQNAANLLNLNNAFIKAEVIAFVNQRYPGFFANANNFVSPLNAANTCSRDVGYLIDSVSFDLLHGGNKQAIQSGVYYYNFNANETQIRNQIVQTTAAYDFIGTIIGDILQNKTISAYDQVKCARDTGLIVDSLLLDLAYSGNSQSKFAGLQYWAQAESDIPNQAEETVAAIRYTANLASNIVLNILAPNIQSNVSQIRGVAATTAEANILVRELSLISNIILNGTVGVTNQIIPNGYPASTNANIVQAANLLQLNKSFIQTEVLAYIDLAYPGFFANANNFIDVANARATCSRDVGYILDSITFDLKHGGNKQAIQSGVYYYNFNANETQIADQIDQTNAAYDFIGRMVNDIVVGKQFSVYNQEKCERDTGLIIDSIAMDIAYGSNTQSKFAGLQYWAQAESDIPNQAEETIAALNYAKTIATNIIANTLILPRQVIVPQVRGLPGTTNESNIISAGFNIVTDIIQNGTVGVTNRIIPNGLDISTNVNVLNASNLIIRNNTFIKAEVIAFVNDTYPGFFANALNFIDSANAQATCSRDVGYILDSLVFDLQHGGNRQAITSGVYYYNFDATETQIVDQIVPTNKAYNFIGNMVKNIVVGTRFGATYNQDKCERDTGLIVDSLAFDLGYDSDTQSKFAGLQYWAQAESDIPNQAEETIAALNYAKVITANIVANVQVANIQPGVQQVFAAAGNAATSAEGNIIISEFNIITDIIQNGTVGVSNRIIPNNYPANTNANINRAANLIYQNNAFIKAEVIAFVNQQYPGFFANANNFVGSANAQVTCSRDVGYILDSISFDLVHGGNRQAITSGVYYYNFDTDQTQIRNQVAQTTKAYDYIGSIVNNIVTATPLAAPYQTDYTQNTTAAVAATSAQANVVLDRIGLINRIINYGPEYGGTRYPIQNTANANTSVRNATTLLLANKDFIKAEVLAYVNSQFFDPPYQDVYRQNTRAAAFATSAQANAALQKVSVITNIIANGPNVAGAKTPIVLTPSADANAINAARLILANRDYIKAETIAYLGKEVFDPPYQFTYKQNTTAAPAATRAEANVILNNISLIKDIIKYGPAQAGARIPIGLTANTNPNVVNAAKLILANRDYIKAETIAFINEELFDPPNQTKFTQNTTAAPAVTSTEANAVINNINLITNIIENGPTVAGPRIPIQYKANVSTNVQNAVKIILANREYITEEVAGYVDRNWATISNGTQQFYTVKTSTPLQGNTSVVRFLETITDTFVGNCSISFHQPSYISALGYTFEYIGSGTELATALPYNGGVPIQANEITEEGGGRVYFTSTDQQGDFRIGKGLLFNRVDGTIVGETFNKSLFAVMTPYILAIEG
jgi:hypothetical protein